MLSRMKIIMTINIIILHYVLPFAFDLNPFPWDPYSYEIQTKNEEYIFSRSALSLFIKFTKLDVEGLFNFVINFKVLVNPFLHFLLIFKNPS